MKNYGIIVKGINDLMVESYEKKDKKMVKKLMTEIKRNKDLKKLYAVVDNLTNGEVTPEQTELYINENVKVAKSLSLKQFDTLLEQMSKTESDKLTEDIGYILFEKRTVYNWSKYNKSFENVKNHLIEKNTWEQNTKKKLTQLSEKYTQLNKHDKVLFEQFVKTPKEQQHGLLEESINTCVKKINSLIESVDGDKSKIQLYQMKDKVLSYANEKADLVKSLLDLHKLSGELGEL